MRALKVPLFLVAILIFAGVVTPSVAPPEPDQAIEDEGVEQIRDLHLEPPSPSEPQDRTTTVEEESGTTEATVTDRVNPWGERQVTVGISGEPATWSEGQLSSVEAAINYWNQNHAAYSDYDVEFVLVPNTSRPDVNVQFVSYIDDCEGYEEGGITLACAPRYDTGDTATVPTAVRVRDDRSASGLGESVKHEFGHLLGLEHGEEPMPLMRSRTDFEPKPSVTNASNRENPWHKEFLTVAVTQDGTYSQETLQAHVREPLDFYEKTPGWDGPSPDLRLVEDPANADIILEVTRGDACEMGGGYCWSVSGEQLDRDEALEYYTRFEATFGELDSQYLSWYAGRVIGYALGAEDESELPRTFADPQYADERWFDREPGESDRREGPKRGVTDEGKTQGGYGSSNAPKTE